MFFFIPFTANAFDFYEAGVLSWSHKFVNVLQCCPNACGFKWICRDQSKTVLHPKLHSRSRSIGGASSNWIWIVVVTQSMAVSSKDSKKLHWIKTFYSLFAQELANLFFAVANFELTAILWITTTNQIQLLDAHQPNENLSGDLGGALCVIDLDRLNWKQEHFDNILSTYIQASSNQSSKHWP